MKAALAEEKQDWEVWTLWYDDRLDGRVRNEALELAYVRMEALWNQGPAKVNAEIKRRIEEQISYGDLHAIEGSDIADFAGVVSTDDSRGHRAEPLSEILAAWQSRSQ